MAATPLVVQNLAELLEALGGVAPVRVRTQPPPGTATVDDVSRIEASENRLCELVDGTLVEKVRGYRESLLAGFLFAVLDAFVAPSRLGLVSGPDGMLRLFPGLVRIPDVAYVSWARIPGGRVPSEPVPALVPDLAVEVLSEGNTRAEMERKRGEYFAAGARLVWMVDPDARSVAVHTGATVRVLLQESSQLDGGEVLPGFSLDLRTLFARLDQHA